MTWADGRPLFARAFSTGGAQVQAVNFAVSSNSTEDVISAALDQLLIGKGYTFSLPGATKPAKIGSGPFTGGYYTAPGANSILLLAANIPADPTGFAFPASIDPTLLQQLYTQLKDQKSLVISLVGTDLLKAIGG